jgi:hypothetical protein
VASVRLRRLLAPTARFRLTLLYTGTFLVLGTTVIGITYLLASDGTAIVARPGPGEGVQIKPLSLLLVGDDLVLQQHSADLQHPAASLVGRARDRGDRLRRARLVRFRTSPAPAA